MLRLLVALAVAQTGAGTASGQPEARPAWSASVGDEEQGERVLNGLVTPLPAPKSVRLNLASAWAPPQQLDYDAGPAMQAIAADLHRSLDEGRVTLLVLTFDTLVPYEVGQVALRALLDTGARVELRFAGPTRVKGQPMPEILKLMKETPPPPPLSREQVAKVLHGAYPAVRSCYQQQLEVNALEGQLVVELKVVESGKVDQAKIRLTQLSSPEVEGCVLGVVRGLSFPKLRGVPGFKVVWPFVFKKGEDKAPPPPIRK